MSKWAVLQQQPLDIEDTWVRFQKTEWIISKKFDENWKSLLLAALI